MASLSGQNIKDTFQKLVQVDDNGRLQTGIGTDLGQVRITGSIAASSGFVGSLQGNAATATLATTATSASFASTSSFAQLATTASNAQTASLAQTAISASNATTSSFTVTASFATTSSNALRLAGRDVAQFVTTGSIDVAQTITGSLRITQNLNVLGTASFQYVTASQTVVNQNTISVYASGSILPTAGFVVVDTASVYSGSSFLYNVVDAIWTLNRPLSASLQGTASYALTASNLSALATASYALTASLSTTASNALTASYLAVNATASYAISSSYALTASYVANASSFPFTGSAQITGSLTVIGNVTAANFLGTASYALTASYISGSINVNTGSLLVTASLSGSLLEFTKGDGTTFTVDLPASSASGSNRVFEFTTPSTQWDMAHNFDERHVSVTIYNENHLQIGASQISASDANNVSAYFTYPVAGYAMVLAAGGTTTVSGSNIETGSLATTGSNVFIGTQYVTGSVIATLGFTGSLQGSASFAQNSITASYVLGSIQSASFASTASYLLGTVNTASYAATASYVLGSIESASFASTASYVNTLEQTVTITGSLLLSGSLNSVAISRGGGDSSENLAVGTNALRDNEYTGTDNGNYNTAVGQSSLAGNTTGFGNTALGTSVLNSSLNGNENTGIGFQTMFFGGLLSQNTAIGSRALQSLGNGQATTQTANTALGTNAGRWLVPNASTVAISSASIFIGADSRARANSQINQIVIGTDAIGNGSNTTTIGNLNTTSTILRGTVSASAVTATGNISSSTVTTSGNINNIAITKGKGSLEGNYGLGSSLSNISNTGGGDAGQYNVGIGESSLSSNTTGNYNTATNRSLVSNTTGYWNTAYGYNTMFFNTTGSRNVAIGMWALASINGSDNNVALGTEAGRFVGAGGMNLSSGSIYIGSLTKANANNEANQIVIGTEAIGNGSNTTTIGNNNTTHTYLKGTVSATSFTGSFNANGTTNTTGSGVYLTSPNGTRYKLVVDNSGALTTTLA